MLRLSILQQYISVSLFGYLLYSFLNPTFLIIKLLQYSNIKTKNYIKNYPIKSRIIIFFIFKCGCYLSGNTNLYINFKLQITYKQTMRITSILWITMIMISICMGVSSLPTNLTKTNWKENFGCELDEYQQCSNSFKRDWFIMFMAPWCGHCRRAKPQFQDFYAMYISQIIEENKNLNESEMENIFQSSLQIGLVNCQEQEELCTYFNAKRFPLFTYLTSEKKVIYSTYPARTKQSFMNFTLYHDPQVHSFCQYGELAHTIWDDVYQVIQKNWAKFLILGVVFPSLIGYCLGQLAVTKLNKFSSNKPTENQKQIKKEDQSSQNRMSQKESQEKEPEKKSMMKQQ